MKATTASEENARGRRWAGLRARCAREEGAVGTEMAIVVAVVVTIALAIGALMVGAADRYGGCIPDTAGPGSDCDFGAGGGDTP